MTDYRSPVQDPRASGGDGSGRYVASAPRPPEPPKRRPGFARMLGFFDSATKIIGTLTALIVAIGGAWVAIEHFGSDDSTPKAGPTTNTSQIQACEAAHDMSQAYQIVDDGSVPLAFGTCQWPTTRYTDPDGFTLIEVTPDQPGPGAAEYTSDTFIDIFTSTNCRSFRLRYEFKEQGTGDHPVPISVAGGTARWMGDPGKVYPNTKLGFGVPVPPDADQAYFVRNSSEKVAAASCDG